jgi:hypothetical protein
VSLLLANLRAVVLLCTVLHVAVVSKSCIQEHAYYGFLPSLQPTLFPMYVHLQVSSRCGTPEELKAVIDEAHRLGLIVLMHSHN